MNTFIIQIIPKKSEYDPLAHHVQSELLEAGESAKDSVVATERLFKISGDFSFEQVEAFSNSLLVDPVVENVEIQGFNQKGDSKKKKSSLSGWVLDIWPKPGVADPVGETVVKGLRDLGYKGDIHAVTAQRYLFPKLKESDLIKKIAKQSLANELIHDIRIEKHN